MRKRKTVEIDEIKNHINTILSLDGMGKEYRWGVIQVLSNLLHNTGNYQGWRYLSNNDIAAAGLKYTPGIRYDADNNLLEYDERFKNTDETRRQYY